MKVGSAGVREFWAGRWGGGRWSGGGGVQVGMGWAVRADSTFHAAGHGRGLRV